MIQIRKSKDRGHFDHGWLNTYHTFSFSDYQDPDFMGFETVRVINEDRVKPGEGFGTHGHRDMEIITYVLDGALEHKDSMGNGSVIKPGDVQYMSAGKGVTHSEFNHSQSEPVHFMQIWVIPNEKSAKPRYDQKSFGENKTGQLRLIVSNDGADGSIAIRQDTKIYAAKLNSNQTLSQTLSGSEKAWVQVVRGTIEMNGKTLDSGDGAAVIDEKKLTFKSLRNDGEFLLFTF